MSVGRDAAVEAYRARLHRSKYDPWRRRREADQISGSNKFGLTDLRSGWVIFTVDGYEDRNAADKGSAHAQSFTSRALCKVYREWLRNPAATREQIALCARGEVVSMDAFFNQPHGRAYGRILDAREGVSRVPPRDTEEEKASSGLNRVLRGLLFGIGVDPCRF